MSEQSERAQRGADTMKEIIGLSAPPGVSPLVDAGRDFVFAEVWSRPGLDRRSRFWITLASVCAIGADLPMATYFRAALHSGQVTEPELREFLLQFAVFQGFPKAVRAEALLNQILQERATKTA